jgi:phosphatidylglycerophosphatase A
VFVWAALSRLIAVPWQTAAILSLAILAVVIGIPAATQVARATGGKDPQIVVIDEVAGQLLTLAAAPVAWKTLLVGFILFRGFDIVKPPPARNLERLPEGLGIVMDDVAAGIYGFTVMQVLLHLGWL